MSPARVCTSTARLPSAIALAMDTTSPGSAPSWRTRPRVIATAIALAATHGDGGDDQREDDRVAAVLARGLAFGGHDGRSAAW